MTKKDQDVLSDLLAALGLEIRDLCPCHRERGKYGQRIAANDPIYAAEPDNLPSPTVTDEHLIDQPVMTFNAQSRSSDRPRGMQYKQMGFLIANILKSFVYALFHPSLSRLATALCRAHTPIN